MPELASTDTAITRQASHALEMLATTTPGRRRVIQAAAEEYLSQVDRRRLPLGYDLPITGDHSNRADAYRMRRGHVFAQMLGIACQPSDADLPDTARVVLAAIDATPMRLAGLAYTTGQPDVVALLHMVGAIPSIAPSATHPLFALIPAGQLDGDLVQVVEVGDRLVTVVATPDSEWGIYEVTGWRHLTDAEIADATGSFPGEPFDLVVPVIAGFAQDASELDAQVANAVNVLTARLAELAA